MTICKILEGILPKEKSTAKNAPAPDKKLLEYHFVFACVWAFGGCMMVDKVCVQICLDWRCWVVSFGCVDLWLLLCLAVQARQILT
jgi:dynein heavy chain